MTNIKDYINSRTLPFRSDCPNCGNKNTFVASIVNTEVLFHCFHSSCKLRGRIPNEISLSFLRNEQFNIHLLSDVSLPLSRRDKTFTIPDYFTSPLQNSDCLRYLDKYHLLDYYVGNVDRIKYDPKQHRCVFLLKDDDNAFYGATGRSLGNQWPRWYIYDRIGGIPYKPTCRSNMGSCLLVEDCVSAIIASSVCNCYALLGTNLPTGFYRHFKNFDILYIALDDDATKKSLKLQKELSFHKPTKIIPLQKDIKFFSKQELLTLKETYNL